MNTDVDLSRMTENDRRRVSALLSEKIAALVAFTEANEQLGDHVDGEQIYCNPRTTPACEAAFAITSRSIDQANRCTRAIFKNTKPIQMIKQ